MDSIKNQKYYHRTTQNKEGTKHLLNRFKDDLKNSTTQGLNYIFDYRLHWIERYFWKTCFIGSFILMYYLLLPQYERFMRSPTVMSVEKDYFNWNVSYPAITLCPAQKINEEAYEALVRKYEKGNNTHNVTAFLLKIIRTNFGNIEEFDKKEYNQFVPPKEYASIAAQAFKRFDNSSLTTNTNLSVTIEIAMTEMGMCHVVNSNVAVYDNPLKWNDSLEYQKRNIELSAYDADFFTQLYNYAWKYKVFIHHPDESVHIGLPSYKSQWGGFLTFNLHVWSTRTSDVFRLRSIGFRKCRFPKEPVGERYPIYSYNHCIIECRIKMILKLCGCLPHFYRPLPNQRICHLSELKCIKVHKKQLLSLSPTGKASRQNLAIHCGCVNNCETDTYTKEEEWIANNVSRLRIAVTSFPKVRVVRDVLFSAEDIILRIGGVFNLCLGTSFITLLEYIIIFGKMVSRCSMYLMKKRNLPSSQKNKKPVMIK